MSYGQASSNFDVRRGFFPTALQTHRPSVERSCSASREVGSSPSSLEQRPHVVALMLRRSSPSLRTADLRHRYELPTFVIATNCRPSSSLRTADGRWRFSRTFDLQRHRPTRSPSWTVMSGERPVARFDVIVHCRDITHEYT